MSDAGRPQIIVANWKMHKTLEEALAFIDELKASVDSHGPHVLVAAPFTLIREAAQRAAGSPIVIGAQNMNDASEGAFTGEIAARMLKDAGAQFVLLGHSERRRLFGEDNALIRRKLLRAGEQGLRPLLCIGETLAEREGGQTEEVLATQLTECLEGVDGALFEQLVVAYEPVWAIGTGVAASAEQAQQAHLFCREYLAQHWGGAVAQRLPLLYGGSVTGATASSLMKQPDIDGLLVGGASLKAASFAKIVNFAKGDDVSVGSAGAQSRP